MYTHQHLLTLVSLSNFLSFAQEVNARPDYGKCEPVWRREIPKYQILAEKLELKNQISNLALTCDCMNQNENLGFYTEMSLMVEKIGNTVDKLEKSGGNRVKLDWHEKQKISKILENLQVCQVYMKYEFMRKNMGYLF